MLRRFALQHRAAGDLRRYVLCAKSELISDISNRKFGSYNPQEGAAMKIQELTVEERIQLVEDIWDSIASEQGAVPVPPEHIEVLNRRLESYEFDHTPGRPVIEAVESIRKNL